MAVVVVIIIISTVIILIYIGSVCSTEVGEHWLLQHDNSLLRDCGGNSTRYFCEGSADFLCFWDITLRSPLKQVTQYYI
jgi:hypothetical protein